MTFIRLGMVNAWRNIARSSLAILSMAVAAAFLTNAVSLSRGYPLLYGSRYRTLLGGEIAVYDFPFMGVIPEGESTWEYDQLIPNPLIDLDTFFPELAQRGYLKSTSEGTLSDSDPFAELLCIEGVRGFYPRYQLPAETSVGGYLAETPLRGRDPLLDDALVVSPDELLYFGRWLDASDEGEFVAVLNQHRMAISERDKARVGDWIDVKVPRLTTTANGIGLDYSECTIYQFQIVGLIELPTRGVEFIYESAQGDQVNAAIQLYWNLEEIQIPLSTWHMIWDEVADSVFIPQQGMIMVDDISYLEDTMILLRNQFPQLTFWHVAELVTKALRQLLIEDTAKLPPLVRESLQQSAPALEQSTLPLDLRAPLSFLIFCNAALVIAANMMIMINERRTEIGILKAVGAMGREIATMALTEALAISAVGACSGFIFIRIPAMFNQLLNHVTLLALFKSISTDFLLVIVVASCSALFFGLLPALKMSRSTASEVLRNE